MGFHLTDHELGRGNGTIPLGLGVFTACDRSPMPLADGVSDALLIGETRCE